MIAFFAVVAIFIVNLRRSTTGMGMTAVRFSALGSKSLGISVVRMKIMMAGLAAFVAGIGGGLLAITLGSALTSNYSTLGGEVWLVILVTYGIRSNGAAVYAGLSLTLLSGVSLVYLPKVFDNFVVIGFGLGAISIVKFPDGVLTCPGSAGPRHDGPDPGVLPAGLQQAQGRRGRRSRRGRGTHHWGP